MSKKIVNVPDGYYMQDEDRQGWTFYETQNDRVPLNKPLDYISRQAAIEETWKEPTYLDPINVLTEMRDRINGIPSADVVEVVRCKNCKHRDVFYGEPYCKRDADCKTVLDDWFCADGERRTDG